MDYLLVAHDQTPTDLAPQAGSSSICSPNGIRTRVATLRGWCPWPLDDGALRGVGTGDRSRLLARGEGLEPSITGPEPVVLPITPPPNGRMERIPDLAGGSYSAGPQPSPLWRRLRFW